VYYKGDEPSKMLSIVVIAPILVLLPILLTATYPTSPSLTITLYLIVAWALTLLIWYRKFTKRNALITLAILFTQVLASILLIYGFIFYEVRDPSNSDPINILSYFNPIFLVTWFSVLIFIPIVVKAFDLFLNGKLRVLGVLLAVSAAVIFQIYFFNLFSNSIYNAYAPYGPKALQAAEIFIGFGFFFYYIFLLIPLFFIFGYFQIGMARWFYKNLRDYGEKINRTNLFRILGGILTIIFIFGLVFVYYFLLYTPADYENMFTQSISLFNGDLIYYLTTNPESIPSSLFTNFQGSLKISSLAITMGLMAYSSYRGAYNLALFKDQVETDIKRLGIFNFIIYTSPRSYKTRIIFGVSLIFVFLGISTIFSFLKIHTILFKAAFEEGANLFLPGIIIFATFDGLKLGVSIIGMMVAIGIFLYFMKSKI
ncbi:MAG: hypothetical protein ACFFD2_28490, partial [Promethearchaeota archaeon]